MAELRAMTKVEISSEGAGTCYGRIEEMHTPAELPVLPEVPPEHAAEVRALLVESRVTRVAMISYHVTPSQELLFTALEVDGEWFDLQRRKLTIEVVGQYQWQGLPPQ